MMQNAINIHVYGSDNSIAISDNRLKSKRHNQYEGINDKKA